MVFAAVTRLTRHAPAASSARAASDAVEPVVSTSSTSRMRFPLTEASERMQSARLLRRLHLCRVFIFAGQRGKDGHAPDSAEMLSQQPGLVETPLPKTAAGGRHGNERVAFAQRKGGYGLCQGERRRANAFKFQHQNQFTRLVGIGKSGKGRMDAGGAV